jgi:hypothetical protein
MIKELNRERVRQFRQRQVDSGGIRAEIYLDREMASAVTQFADEHGTTMSTAMRSLLRIGMQIEGLLQPPKRFWLRMQTIVNCFR